MLIWEEWRIFSRCSSCPQHAPVHRFASWATSRGLSKFWIPVGLVLTSRALPFVSVRLDSLCTSTSPFPPGPLDYSARAHFLSTQERALSIPTRLYASYMSPFYYSLYITDPLLSSFILSTDPLPRVIKRDEPKGSIPLAQRLYSPCPKALFPLPTSFPTFLLFTQFVLHHSTTPFDTILYL